MTYRLHSIEIKVEAQEFFYPQVEIIIEEMELWQYDKMAYVKGAKKKMRCIKSDSQGQKLRDYMEGESFYGDREHSLPDLFYQSHVPFEFSPSSYESFAEAPISTSEIKPCAAKECA